jgi:hypothetical protein
MKMMENIKIITDEEIKEYYKLDNGSQFLYSSFVGYFFAIKYNNKYCIALNYENDFFVFKVYDNCISIGAGKVEHFGTYNSAVNYIKRIQKTKYNKQFIN